MAKCLVVVESPAKAKTINKFLGSRYIVRASFGHVRDLPKSELGVDIDNNFAPKYVLPRDSSKAIKDIREAAKKADRILLATDPDREGEAIGWHIAQILRQKTKVNKANLEKPIERIVFNAITKRSIKEAVNQPRSIDENLVNAQQARRILDRLVGYKISPLLQRAIRRGLSAGRVQSVAVRMVCDREQEIRNFVPEEYWTLDALLQTTDNEAFSARLNQIAGEKAKIGSQEEMDRVLAALADRKYQIVRVETKETQRRPYAPFITSTLQQEASRKLGFSPRKTMVLAQQLYEGIALGDQGTEGLITYMRTDSTRLAGEALEEVRAYIGANFEAAMLPEKPNFYASKKGAQDAHEAIRATAATRTPESVKKYLSEDQFKLYQLIWKRYVACQMSPAILDQTTIDVAAGDYEFRATGSVVKFAGFTILYEESKDDGNGDTPSGLLPLVKEGQPLRLEELKPEQHFTKPPARYSEASLIRALEANGIGRPSTYAPTINTIMERGYVVREQRRLYPTELGEEVNGWLIRNFPDIMDLEFTARMEDDLDHVEDGAREWHDLIGEFYGNFAKDLSSAQHSMVRDLLGDEIKCPKCGAEMVLREAWYGLFLGCSKYPDCDGTLSLRKPAQVEATDEVCEQCGGQMVIRSGRFGRFMACSNYPDCKNSFNVDKDGNKVERQPKEPPKKTDKKCPDCEGMLVIRKSRRGDDFYGCENYPKCKFTRPMELGLKCLRPGCDGDLVTKIARRRRFIACDKYPKCDFTAFGTLDKEHACPKCGNSWTTVSKPRNKPHVRRCPSPNCDYEQEIPESKDD